MSKVVSKDDGFRPGTIATSVLGDNRTTALALAVIHHGLSNLAERSIPSRAETIIETSSKFEAYLNGEDVPTYPRH